MLKTVFVGSLGDKSIYDQPSEDCERPFVVVPIPGSNLILVVFDALECPVDRSPSVSKRIYTSKYEDNNSLACERQRNPLPRIRPLSCINHHVNESLIDQCGQGYCVLMSSTLIAFVVILQTLL
ncbi:Voltage-dependent calcium channel subunit alpha-2/delta-3 [Pseudolycoriella hygida]|uniref:Voltage-dependent calcium channel subunit alpha-2/delta-3 n=1 Tax=Pseudolycoriella hygida TaxID=35572 RepID=A0A9Q0S3U5_9DIPT|nr:Voltage-dependent calcium channel subunit alpha-2/delta-3 [Pseudolycoriella hygida]